MNRTAIVARYRTSRFATSLLGRSRNGSGPAPGFTAPALKLSTQPNSEKDNRQTDRRSLPVHRQAGSDGPASPLLCADTLPTYFRCPTLSTGGQRRPPMTSIRRPEAELSKRRSPLLPGAFHSRDNAYDGSALPTEPGGFSACAVMPAPDRSAQRRKRGMWPSGAWWGGGGDRALAQARRRPLPVRAARSPRLMAACRRRRRAVRGGVLIRIVRPSMLAPQRIQPLRNPAVRHDEPSRARAAIRQARLHGRAAGGT